MRIFRHGLLVLALALVFAALQGCVVFVPFLPEKQKAEDDCNCGVSGPGKIPSSAVYPQQTYRSKQLSPAEKKAQSKVKRLIRELRHEEVVVRIRAAGALGYMGSPGRVAIKPLILSLHDEHKWVRRTAAKSLGRLNARSAVPSLARRLRDNDPWVAHSAANALRKIGTPDALSALRQARL